MRGWFEITQLGLEKKKQVVAAQHGDSTSRLYKGQGTRRRYNRRQGSPVLTGPAAGFVGLLMGLCFGINWVWVGLEDFGLVWVKCGV